ncbi:MULTISPECIES: hypothetical protein [unclassified Meridianimarinicoccus]|nr:hypothetical protein [Fluviibacterium sp. MJW13]
MSFDVRRAAAEIKPPWPRTAQRRTPPPGLYTAARAAYLKRADLARVVEW